MSEALGEARIIIRPDTTLFRGQLEEQLAALKKPIVIPVTTTATGAGRNAADQIKEQTVETEKLTAQQRLQVQAAEQVAAAQRANALATQGVITQQDRAALATNAAATADRNLQAALLTEDEELIGAAAATANLAREQAALAGTAAAAARTQQQVAKGAFSATASQFGLRGATLAASVGFIAAAVGVTALSKTLKASLDASEQLQVQMERLRTSVDEVTATKISNWAGGLANSFGVSRLEAVKMVATLEQLFKNFGFATENGTKMSEELVRVAANLSIAQKVPFAEALQSIQRGLAGNGRALRTFNVFVDQARVAQEALIETGKKQTSDLTRQELVLARYNLILRDSADRAHAFADAQGTLAAQSRIASANVQNFETAVGGPVKAVLTGLLRGLNETAKGFTILDNTSRKAGQDTPGVLNRIAAAEQKIPGASFFNSVAAGLGRMTVAASDALHRGLDPAAGGASGLNNALIQTVRDSGDAAAAMDRLAEAAQHATTALKQAQTAVTGLQFQQLQIQTGLTPGGSGAELANLRQQEAAQKKVVAETASGSKARREALQELLNIQNQEQAIIDANAAAAAATQRKAEAAARKQEAAAKRAAAAAKKARDARDKAFLAIIGGAQAKLTNRIVQAQSTETLADDVRASEALDRFFTASIARIHRAEELGKITAAAASKAIATIVAEQTKNNRDLVKLIQDQAKQAADTRQQILQINIQIAQVTKNRSAEVAADKAYIAFLEAQIKKAKGNRLRIAQLRLELAQTRADLKGLIGEQKQNAAAQSEFAFLQAQQGFAANLLGNLIPGGKTGGLVGNVSTSATPAGLRQVSGGFEEPRGALSTRARIAGAPTGPSSGQASTTNELLRRILRTLEHLNTRTNHPEAARQRQTMNAAMDGVHGN